MSANWKADRRRVPGKPPDPPDRGRSDSDLENDARTGLLSKGFQSGDRSQFQSSIAVENQLNRVGGSMTDSVISNNRFDDLMNNKVALDTGALSAMGLPIVGASSPAASDVMPGVLVDGCANQGMNSSGSMVNLMVASGDRDLSTMALSTVGSSSLDPDDVIPDSDDGLVDSSVPAKNTRYGMKRKEQNQSLEDMGGLKYNRKGLNRVNPRSKRKVYVSPVVNPFIKINTATGLKSVSPRTKHIVSSTSNKNRKWSKVNSSGVGVLKVGFDPGTVLKCKPSVDPIAAAIEESRSVIGTGIIVDLTDLEMGNNSAPEIVFKATRQETGDGSKEKPSYAGDVKGDKDSKVGKIVLSYIPPCLTADGSKVVKLKKEQLVSAVEACSLTVYGYCIGGSLSFGMVRYHTLRMWKEHGIIDVSSNNRGVFLFKFANEEGMMKVLEFGVWLINNIPLCLKKWEPNLMLVKTEPKQVLIWASIPDLPLEFWGGEALSSIISFVGMPVMLDSLTEYRCLHQSGRAGFARFFVQVSAEEEIIDYVDIKYPDWGKFAGKMAKLKVEYQWKPPRCDHCKVFGHKFIDCVHKPRVEVNQNRSYTTADLNETSSHMEDDDGFVQVGKKNKGVNREGIQQGVKGRESVFTRMQGYNGPKPVGISKGNNNQRKDYQNDSSDKSGSKNGQNVKGKGMWNDYSKKGQNGPNKNGGKNSGINTNTAKWQPKIGTKKDGEKKKQDSVKDKKKDDGQSSETVVKKQKYGSLFENKKLYNRFSALRNGEKLLDGDVEDITADYDDQFGLYSDEKDEIWEYVDNRKLPPIEVLEGWSKKQQRFFYYQCDMHHLIPEEVESEDDGTAVMMKCDENNLGNVQEIPCADPSTSTV